MLVIIIILIKEHGTEEPQENLIIRKYHISFFPVSSKRKDLCTDDATYNDRKSEYNFVTEPNLRK